MKSWKPQVVADSSGWSDNGLRFFSKNEAERWAEELRRRWILVTDARAVEDDQEPNYGLSGAGELVSLTEAERYPFQHFAARADMVLALRRYAYLHYPLGDFLRSLVSNDLFEALGRADQDNLHNLPALGAFVYNELPRSCWGSPQAYKAWVEVRNVKAADEEAA